MASRLIFIAINNFASFMRLNFNLQSDKYQMGPQPEPNSTPSTKFRNPDSVNSRKMKVKRKVEK